jgi:diguanylate cyclase (GGDEF)-like protein
MNGFGGDFVQRGRHESGVTSLEFESQGLNSKLVTPDSKPPSCAGGRFLPFPHAPLIMQESVTRSSTDLLRRNPALRRLVRFLAAAPEGIHDRYLSAEERDQVEVLVREGLAQRKGSRLRLADRAAAEAVLENSFGEPEERGDDIAVILSFIQQLHASSAGLETVGELVEAGAQKLFERVEFDVAAFVVFDESLETFVVRRAGTPPPKSDAFAEMLAAVLLRSESMVVEPAEIRISLDAEVLPAAVAAAGFDFEGAAALLQGNRTVGLLVVYRAGSSFEPNERKTIEIVASQLGFGIGGFRARERIQTLADTDELTGIKNRRYFRRVLASEFDRARLYNLPLSLLMIDVDDFKKINDGHGHPVGDVLLSELCGTIKGALRQLDVFGRTGGDEFAVLLLHTPMVGAVSVAHRIVQRAGVITIPADEEALIRCSVSVGVAAYESTDENADNLMRRADERLYAAKRAGKNQYKT